MKMRGREKLPASCDETKRIEARNQKKAGGCRVFFWLLASDSWLLSL
jgi:hypothetical protein